MVSKHLSLKRKKAHDGVFSPPPDPLPQRKIGHIAIRIEGNLMQGGRAPPVWAISFKALVEPTHPGDLVETDWHRLTGHMAIGQNPNPTPSESNH